MPTGFRLYDPATGRVKRTTTSAHGLIFGRLSIGGTGAAQDGSITDARLAQGDPLITVLRGNFYTTTQNYQPTIWVSGPTLYWHFPQADGSVSYYRPVVNFLYGVR